MLPAGREPTGTEEEATPEVDSEANKSIELDAIDGGDPALTAIHSGRRVPIYRKLGGV